MSLPLILWSEGWDGDGERVGVSTGADINANTRGGSALERGHGASLEPLAQLGYALGGEGAIAATIEATELVAGQAAKGKEEVSMGADTKANASWGRRTRGW